MSSLWFKNVKIGERMALIQFCAGPKVDYRVYGYKFMFISYKFISYKFISYKL